MMILDVMKYEVNRYNSFMGRWPLNYITLKDLAKNGFFHLLSEDCVQCAFCSIIIDDWNVGDTPLKKHNSTSLSGQAKYPMMAEVNYIQRLPTYKDWPLIMLSPRQLSECGLFYTDKKDIVTCFYCGGSLGNWELNDDPWVEHEKYFPDCGYLNLVKCHRNPKQHSTHHNLEEEKLQSKIMI
ncbi:hypothetical protein CDAR_244562 [Caerostris darwini]|uniref:Uncharacterized protein n=1 Tax=Caerostris darwini TaxID=1538125 RepID=A0AAV4RC63_9ARAC|nr:hypothetical protein CDAR_244562 [Caerostris darwini]